MQIKLPNRPVISNAAQVSKLGNQVQLVSNLFPLSLEAASSGSDEPSTAQTKSSVDVRCFQYDVDFEPEVAEDNRTLRYKIFKVGKPGLEKIIGKFCFSGKSLYTLRRLSQDKIQSIEDPKSTGAIGVDGINYSMRIRFTKEFAMDADEAKSEGQVVAKKGNKVTQVLNIVLKQVVRDLKFQEIGKNSKFFDIKSKAEVPIKDRDGKVQSVLEAYKGFQFGTHPSANKLYLMVDFASRILRKETALEFINANSSQQDRIVGESVITEYNNYQIYKIDAIDRTKTPASTFLSKKTNQQVSFANYYKSTYGIQVKDMRQPLLLHNRKFREANTNIEKIEQVFLIPEICKMTGMTDEQRANFGAMRDLSAHTKLTPDARFKKSLEFGSLLANNAASSGVKINTANSKVNAIVLSPPLISFSGKSLTPKDGNYDFKNPITDKTNLKEWSFVYQERDRDEADNFISNINKSAATYGITISEPFYFEQKNLNSKDWINALDKDFDKNGLPSFVVSFAPQIPQARTLYNDLKKFLYSEVGLEHQHVNPKSVQKNGLSVASKIALQIAAKTGSRLWEVQVPTGLNKNTMLIGIETSMKKIADNKKMKQVIGVVASINSQMNKFYSEVDVRDDKDTALPTLSSIIKSAIAAYLKNTKALPEEVVIFRQGLGEGQVMQSLQHEIEAVKKGFASYKQGYSPRFAFFQVNKKIGQKFYQDNTGKPGLQNPTSGSLIADGVVGKNFEFYLCAQNCNSGVCTPTKYTCLYNDTQLSEGSFWQLTYFQCYNYYNWQGPVRVPAPMMYAGKLAKFTSDVLGKKAHNNLVNSVYYL